MGVAMQGLSKIFRAPIIKIIRYRAHRAVIFATAWHLVAVGDDKKKNGREGKERYTKSQVGFTTMGSRPR